MKNTQRGFMSVVIVIVVLLIATGGIYFYVNNNSKTTITEDVKVGNDVEVTDGGNNKINNVVNNKDVSTTSVTKSEADKGTNEAVSTGKNYDLWPIFDKSVLALKNKDVKAFNKISYKQVAVGEEESFISMASGMYKLASEVVKSEYVNKIGDSKQYIYSTPLNTTEEGYAYKQGVVIFIKDGDTWKLLLNNENYWGISKAGTNKTLAEVQNELRLMTKDSDNDGLTDDQENCSGASEYKLNCKKTDPNKKDTDGDGWWDGINAIINK